MLIEDNATVLFIGDSITDAGRSRENDYVMGHGVFSISGAVFRPSAVRANGLVDDDCDGLFPFEFNVVTWVRLLASTAGHDRSPQLLAEMCSPAELFHRIMNLSGYILPARVTQELYHLSTFLPGFPGDPMH